LELNINVFCEERRRGGEEERRRGGEEERRRGGVREQIWRVMEIESQRERSGEKRWGRRKFVCVYVRV
jgi:hypothetical protein